MLRQGRNLGPLHSLSILRRHSMMGRIADLFNIMLRVLLKNVDGW